MIHTLVLGNLGVAAMRSWRRPHAPCLNIPSGSHSTSPHPTPRCTSLSTINVLVDRLAQARSRAPYLTPHAKTRQFKITHSRSLLVISLLHSMNIFLVSPLPPILETSFAFKHSNPKPGQQWRPPRKPPYTHSCTPIPLHRHTQHGTETSNCHVFEQSNLPQPPAQTAAHRQPSTPFTDSLQYTPFSSSRRGPSGP